MRVQYETKIEDLQEWRSFYLELPEVRAHVRSRRMMRGVMVAIPVFMMLTVAFQDPAQALFWGAAAFGGSIFLETLSEKRQWRAALKNAIENRDGMSPLGKNTLEVTDDFVAQVSQLFSYSFQWELVRRVFIGSTHVFFVLRNYQGIVVPMQSIEPSADRETFLERLERCMPVELRGDGEQSLEE